MYTKMNSKKYADEERLQINHNVLYGSSESNNNSNNQENHCTNKHCPFFTENISNNDEEFCPECGEYTTYFYRKEAAT